MADEKKEKKSPAKKVADVAKTAVKAVAADLAHPGQALKHPIETAKHIAHDVKAAVAGVGTTPSLHVRGSKRALEGVVRSDKMDKTVVVEVVRLERDPVYGKYLKNRSRYHAHDEKNEFHPGDKVEIQEHRPLSRHKRWIVSRLIERAKVE